MTYNSSLADASISSFYAGYSVSNMEDKLGNDTSTQIQHWVTNVDITNVHSLFHTLGLPVTGGLGLGFLAGFVRTR
jgi:hypothetical protein